MHFLTHSQEAYQAKQHSLTFINIPVHVTLLQWHEIVASE